MLVRTTLNLTQLIEEGLALRLRQAAKASASPRPLPLPVHHGRGGLNVAVGDGCSNRQLLDAADGLSRP